MTIYDDVKEFETRLGAYIVDDPPKLHWAQLGNPTMTCESYAVGTTGVREQALYPLGARECQMLQIIDLVAEIARECAFEGNQDGTTNPDEVIGTSEQQDADTEALMAWAVSLPRPPETVSLISFENQGALAVTTLITSAYAGWSTEP